MLPLFNLRHCRGFHVNHVPKGNLVREYKVPPATLARKEEWTGITTEVVRLSNILGARRRLANAKSSMLQGNKRDFF